MKRMFREGSALLTPKYTYFIICLYPINAKEDILCQNESNIFEKKEKNHFPGEKIEIKPALCSIASRNSYIKN